MISEGIYATIKLRNCNRRKEKFIMRTKLFGGGGKLSHVVAVALCCVLLAGCSNIKNPAKAPFSAKDCAGMTSEKVMTDLQKAGFTNVTVVDEETTSKSSDGIVVSLSLIHI